MKEEFKDNEKEYLAIYEEFTNALYENVRNYLSLVVPFITSLGIFYFSLNIFFSRIFNYTYTTKFTDKDLILISALLYIPAFLSILILLTGEYFTYVCSYHFRVNEGSVWLIRKNIFALVGDLTKGEIFPEKANPNEKILDKNKSIPETYKYFAKIYILFQYVLSISLLILLVITLCITNKFDLCNISCFIIIPSNIFIFIYIIVRYCALKSFCWQEYLKSIREKYRQYGITEDKK